jgi:hypothetical protein
MHTEATLYAVELAAEASHNIALNAHLDACYGAEAPDTDTQDLMEILKATEERCADCRMALRRGEIDAAWVALSSAAEELNEVIKERSE